MRQYMDFGLPGQGHPEAEDLAIVIDVSASMDADDYLPTRLMGAMAAASVLVDVKAKGAPSDRVAVVGFSGVASIVLALTELQGNERRIKRRIGEITTDGCTNISAGLRRACEVLGGETSRLVGVGKGVLAWIKKGLFEVESSASQGAIEQSRARRILLLSDGGYNDGGDPVPVASELKRQGIVIDVIGISASPDAEGFCEEDLRRIASSPTDGREHYCFIGDTQALIKKFESLAFRIKPLEV